MVRWYHTIFTAYGFWLPNDPRGSWSDFVASWELYKFGGAATKTDERRSLANDPHDASFRLEAKAKLKYPPVKFDDRQRALIATGFAQACDESAIQIHALTIGFDHCHGIIGRHPKPIEDVVHHLKSRATKHLRKAGQHPLEQFVDAKGAAPQPWAEGCWKVFINDEQQLNAAIKYVERHPFKEGLSPQRWPFVIPV